jgi:hypothetical protein
LENAFCHFGVVPQTLVIDNLQAAVLRADWFDPDWCPSWLANYCGHVVHEKVVSLRPGACTMGQGPPGKIPGIEAMLLRSLLVGSLICGSTIVGRGADKQGVENPDGGPPAMSVRVDELLGQQAKAAGVNRAELSGDAEFLRRVHFDLCGVLPTVAAARSFLSDPRPDKRVRLIDELLEHPDHATHLADTWRQFLLPGDLDAERQNDVRRFQNWLRTQFVRNRRYDNIVADLLVPEDITPSSEAGAASLF